MTMVFLPAGASLGDGTTAPAMQFRQDGSFKIGTPALGFIKDGGGELVIDEQEAETVRYIFKQYLNGKGSYVIARELTEKGTQTIRGLKNGQMG